MRVSSACTSSPLSRCRAGVAVWNSNPMALPENSCALRAWLATRSRSRESSSLALFASENTKTLSPRLIIFEKKIAMIPRKSDRRTREPGQRLEVRGEGVRLRRRSHVGVVGRTRSLRRRGRAPRGRPHRWHLRQLGRRHALRRGLAQPLSFIGPIGSTKADMLVQLATYIPAEEHIMVGNDPSVFGQSADSDAAAQAGWRFIREEAFAGGPVILCGQSGKLPSLLIFPSPASVAAPALGGSAWPSG